jgi:predicted nucleic acid-binding protein
LGGDPWAIAVIDERAGTRHARERDVEVHGTLWLIAQSVRQGLLAEERSEELVAALRDTEAWFPDFDGGFVGWARENGLL